ncbi:hypothetical protein BV898_17544 [Hypsibius exemplaris]|uniref:Uncharacterized protein n=1 Tax=Hypsibius exemplaris TaxID=2072580 RepID=A0A9X6NMG6_HYPEX|nr:hypothetical protein BV898_17544 [Hypsibius exemplaris]
MQATAVITNLRDLLKTTAKLRGKERHLQKRLEIFYSASGRHVSTFEGARLLHITRIFIVTTLSLTLSIAVLCYELLNLHILEK